MEGVNKPLARCTQHEETVTYGKLLQPWIGKTCISLCRRPSSSIPANREQSNYYGHFKLALAPSSNCACTHIHFMRYTCLIAYSCNYLSIWTSQSHGSSSMESVETVKDFTCKISHHWLLRHSWTSAVHLLQLCLLKWVKVGHNLEHCSGIFN